MPWRRRGKAAPADAPGTIRVAPAPEDKPLVFMDGVPSVRDILAPSVVDRRDPSALRLGRTWSRTYVASTLPAAVHVGWLHALYDQMAPVDVAIHFGPYDSVEALESTIRTIARLEARIIAAKGNLSQVQELQKAISDLAGIRSLLVANEARYWRVTIAATVYGDSKADVEARSAVLEHRLAAQHMYMRPAEMRMDQGFLTTAPLGVNLLPQEFRNLDSYAAATTYPWLVADLAHERGVPLGFNRGTGAPVILDPFDRSLPNHSVLIAGRSGAGKSVAMKTFLARGRALAGWSIVILDREAEYVQLAEALGGTVVTFGDADGADDKRAAGEHDPGGGENDPGAGADAEPPATILNPFDLATEINERGKPVVPLDRRVKEIGQLIAAMCHGLDPVELTAVERAIYALYDEAGITRDPASLTLAPGERGPDGLIHLAGAPRLMPTLSDFRALAEQDPALRRVAAILPRYCQGGSTPWFDGQTRVPIDDGTAFLVWNLKPVERSNALPLALHVALTWSWEEFAKHRPAGEKKLVVVDEGADFARLPQTLEFLLTVARRARKRTGGLIIATQTIGEFLASNEGKGILANCATTLLLGQEDVVMPTLAETLGLSDGEAEYLRGCVRGQGLLRLSTQDPRRAARQSYAVETWISEAEEAFARTTDPALLAGDEEDDGS